MKVTDPGDEEKSIARPAEAAASGDSVMMGACFVVVEEPLDWGRAVVAADCRDCCRLAGTARVYW